MTGMQMRLVTAQNRGAGGLAEVSGGGGGEFISRETGRSAVCRWWLAGAPQLGPPPAWPLGVPH